MRTSFDTIGKTTLAGLLLLVTGAAQAALISPFFDRTDFVNATGATSLTGPLPDLAGSQGTSVTLGDATLTAGNSIFVGTGWSTLLPNQRAIAISGPENLTVAINTGPVNAFGFYFHEPGSSTAQLNGCNTVCVESTFRVDLLLNNVLVDSSVTFSSANDTAVFIGLLYDVLFDEVRFTEIVGTNDNEFYGEMFAGVAVPAPATLLLFGAGLLGFGVTGRSRR